MKPLSYLFTYLAGCCTVWLIVAAVSDDLSLPWACACSVVVLAGASVAALVGAYVERKRAVRPVRRRFGF